MPIGSDVRDASEASARDASGASDLPPVHVASASRGRLWAGRIISGLVVLFLVWDGVIKVMELDVVMQGMVQLGYPAGLAAPIGLILLACVGLYAYPRTGVLGAILLTGYLGGALVTQLRVGNPLFTHTLFPTYVGALAWLGLYLRDDVLRALVTARRGLAR